MNKISSGCLTPALSGAQKRVVMLCHTRIFGDPQHKGAKSEVAASPLPSRGPNRGQTCYVILAFSEVPEQGFKKGPHQATGYKPLRAGDKIRSCQQVARRF